jgi:hypothetical protein
MIASHGIRFIQPSYYLAKGPPRIQPDGGGAAVVAALTRPPAASVQFRCLRAGLVTEGGRIARVAVSQAGSADTIPPMPSSRLRRLPGERRDDARARPRRGHHAADLA